MMDDLTPDNILEFWFGHRARKNWFKKNANFDAEIRKRFGELHVRAGKGKLERWRSTARGRLAEIIVLDQFSRNLYRDSSQAFAQDELARRLVREAISDGSAGSLESEQLAFLYMPLMHSESAGDHEEALRLFSSDPGLSSYLKYEKMHKAIIDRFGRYPHRNAVLGRESTASEQAFLEQPNSSF